MIFLDRMKFGNTGTFGMLVQGTEQLCFTCELPWEDNKPNLSCIPTGMYNVIKWTSEKVPKGFRIQDVPGRSDIDIHCGNTIEDIEGCVLVGTVMGKLGNLPAVLNSHVAMEELYEKLPDAFLLTITGTP